MKRLRSSKQACLVPPQVSFIHVYTLCIVILHLYVLTLFASMSTYNVHGKYVNSICIGEGKRGKEREREGKRGKEREREGKRGKEREREGKRGEEREREGKRGEERGREGKRGKEREREGKRGEERERHIRKEREIVKEETA